MKITVGPIQFFWSAERFADFYAELAAEPCIDRVVLGELVCSKRLPFLHDAIATAVELLRGAGKEVVLTSPALVTLKRERAQLAGLASTWPQIEVNDLTMLAHLPAGTPFSVGPMVNIYSDGTLSWLAARGARRICLPPELPQEAVAHLCGVAAGLNVEIEQWAFGRLPLAISGRCYHARLHGRAKDNCQFVCGEDPDGLTVATVDGVGFLAMNGVQTVSDAYAMYAPRIAEFAGMGVGSLRLSPQTGDFVAVCRLFHACARGEMTADEVGREISALFPDRALLDRFTAAAEI